MNNECGVVLPKWPHYLFGCALFLYTVQPWSFHLGAMPLQVLLVWLLFGWATLAKPTLIIKVVKAYGPVIIGCILIIVLSVSYRILSDDSNWLRLFQIFTGIAISVVTALLINDEKN